MKKIENGVFKMNTADPTTARVEQIETFDLISAEELIHTIQYMPTLPEFLFDGHLEPNKFASSLVETCIKHHGVALHAMQCGFNENVFVVGAGEDYVAFFNAKLINKSPTLIHMQENSLSFPLLSLNINRSEQVMVEYQDFHGLPHKIILSGMTARYFQQMIDISNGILYTERVKPLALASGLKKRDKMIKKVAKVQSFKKIK